MKNFKIKYIAFVLVIGFLNSCATEDAIQVEEQAVNKDTDFVFEPNIDSFTIDGVVSTDRQEIAYAAKDAWNVHHDFPNRKVIISTTPEQFEKTKNSNPEYKKLFEQKAVEHVDEYINSPFDDFSSSISSAKVTYENQVFAGTGSIYVDPNYNIYTHNSESDTNDLVLHIHYTAGGAGINVYFNVDLYTTTNTTVNSTVQKASSQNNNGMAVANTSVFRKSMFEISPDSYGGSIVRNHSKINKTLTIYQNLSYGGTSKSWTFLPGGKMHTNLHLLFSGVGAKSLKVVN